MNRRTAARILLLATLVMAAACLLCSVGCSSPVTHPYGEIDGVRAEAVWMTPAQMREYEAWRWQCEQQELEESRRRKRKLEDEARARGAVVWDRVENVQPYYPKDPE